jgi:uncharacterized protein YkwD
MTRRWPAIVLMALTLVPAACGGGSSSPTEPSPSPSTPASSQIVSAIIDATNAERAKLGLPTLRTNTRLNDASQLQADQIAQLNVLSHELPGARYPSPPDRLAAAGYNWQAYGENLAFGQRDAARAVADWMASEGHRANIVNTTFTEIGAAYKTDGNGFPYYVEMFGKPR